MSILAVQTFWDVADSAVKIGLGALLGVAAQAFLAAKEWIAERHNRRIRSLEDICTRMEDILSTWLMSWHDIMSIVGSSGNQLISKDQHQQIVCVQRELRSKIQMAYGCTLKLRLTKLPGLAEDLAGLLNFGLSTWRELDFSTNALQVHQALDKERIEFAERRNKLLERLADEIHVPIKWMNSRN